MNDIDLTTKERIIEKCLQCGKIIEIMVIREITQRDNRAYRGLRSSKEKFCSNICASHYQMGCEG
jgi:hypothetical protein